MAKKKRIVVIGCKGQLGAELLKQLSGKYELFGLSRAEIDITNQEMTLREIRKINPDLIINTAAFTNVDGCELEPKKAMDVNCGGAGNVARVACEIDAKLIYFSTDYVFSGNRCGEKKPYTESDKTDPINIYGKSKLAGEQLVAEISDNHLIIRVSWLYSNRRDSFLLSMLKLGEKQIAAKRAGGVSDNIFVVNDQVGSPTWVRDLALQTELLIDEKLTGIIHSASDGEVSRYELIRTMFELLNMDIELIPCSSEKFKTAATRPHYTPMENSIIKKSGLNRMHHWKDSLSEFLCEYQGEKRKLTV